MSSYSDAFRPSKRSSLGNVYWLLCCLPSGLIMFDDAPKVIVLVDGNLDTDNVQRQRDNDTYKIQQTDVHYIHEDIEWHKVNSALNSKSFI
jgi:hypothetical protein